LNPLYVETQKGLGDNIYARAFVKTLVQKHDLYLATPWPELYEDLPVRFVRAETNLRTQAKNIARQSREFHQVPPRTSGIHPAYGSRELLDGGLIHGLQRHFGCEPAAWDLPLFENVIEAKKPICVVRPATVRSEWTATARNPRPEYIAEVVERIRDRYFVVSVADLQGTAEYALEPMPYADLKLHAGELNVKHLLGLIQAADIVIGGVGWIVPACIASHTRLICVLGGNGGYNAPERITDPRMDLSRAHFVRPDDYCMCARMQHNCDKRISNLDQQIEAILEHLD
jgi:hypothetical protein